MLTLPPCYHLTFLRNTTVKEVLYFSMFIGAGNFTIWKQAAFWWFLSDSKNSHVQHPEFLLLGSNWKLWPRDVLEWLNVCLIWLEIEVGLHAVISEVHSFHVWSACVRTSKILILASYLLVNPRFRLETGDRKLLFV